METRAAKRRNIESNGQRFFSEIHEDPVVRELHEHGFAVIKRKFDIPDSVSNYLKDIVEKKGRAIFNHNENSNRNDHKRVQVNVTTKSKYMKHYMDELNSVLVELFPHLEPNDWVVIGSKPGCNDQDAHTDYPPILDMRKDEMVPINVLIALEPRTFINVWSRSHRLICNDLLDDEGNSAWDTMDHQIAPIDMQTLELSKGDLLFFRGDLVHAGASYETSNHRLHCYLDSWVREKNRTWLIHKHASADMANVIRIPGY